MTPERLKELNRLHGDVESLEHALRAHRAPGHAGDFGRAAPSKDALARAAAIIERDLVEQLAAAKRAFAAADEERKPDRDHPLARTVDELRELADRIAHHRALVRSVTHGGSIDGGLELRIEWREVTR